MVVRYLNALRIRRLSETCPLILRVRWIFDKLLSSRSNYGIPSAIAALKGTGEFQTMSKNVDEEEHSIEMHLPYIRKIFEQYVLPFLPSLDKIDLSSM